VSLRMREEAQAALDRVEALPVGHGKVDLAGYLHGNRSVGSVGAVLEYEHRMSTRWSTFGRGWAAYTWAPQDRGSDFGMLGGIRYRW
jgi:hypothetical protein